MVTGRIVKFEDGKGKVKCWAYVINLPKDEHGKYQQKKRQGFRTRNAAEAAMRQALTDIDQGAVVTRSMTVTEYLSEWLRRSVEGKRAPRTLETYQHTIGLITPHIGQVKLDKLEPHQIERLYQSVAQGHAAATVHRVHSVLSAALNRAVRWGYLQASPMLRVDAPAMPKSRRNVLSMEELAQVEDWLRDSKPVVWLGVYLAARTGLRRGELCGLRWRDADLSRAVLRVVQQRQHRRGQTLVGPTKTDGSARPVPIGNSVVATLREWQRQHQEHTRLRGESWTEDAYVLCHMTGEEIHPSTLSHDFLEAVRACKTAQVSFHDLRHTHATILLESGAPMKVIAERLGHNSTRMAEETYTHLRETIQRDAVEMIEKAFRNTSEK